MTYFFMIVTVAAGLLHETKTTGFETKKACQDYAEVVLDMYLAFNHQILEVECKPLDTGV